MMAGVAGALALALLVPDAQGQRQDAAPAEKRIRAVATDQRLTDLLEIASYTKGIPIVWSPGDVAGSVRVQAGMYFDDAGIWSLAVSSLAMDGLAIIQAPESDVLRVVAADKAAGLARLEKTDLAGAQAGFLKTLVPLRELQADKARAAVNLVLSGKGSKVETVAEANSLLIADFAPQLRQALELVALLDAPEATPELLEVRLERADPRELAALLSQIKAKEMAVSGRELRGEVLAMTSEASVLLISPAEEIEHWQSLIQRFDREVRMVTEHYMPRRFGLLETVELVERAVHGTDGVLEGDTWKLVADELTGTLILTTTPAKQREVANLLARLESADAVARRPMRTFPIKHRQVSEILELLDNLLAGGVLELPPESDAQSGEVQGATAPLVRRRPRVDVNGGDIVLTSDEGTNRLIAVGEARLLDQLGPLIQSLDVQEAQVLVEAMVVNLTENQMRDLGVELAAIGSSNGMSYGLASLFGLGAQDPASPTLPSQSGQGFAAAVLNPGSFSAVLKALETVNDGRTQTMPRMLVNNNETATLDSVLESPYTSTNASNTVATTSFGGSSEAGTQVSIKPQVAAGDRIVIDYSISLSGFTADSADPNLPPPKQGTTMKSVVTVPDGFTVIVGGIEQEVDTEGESRVPFLGSIPIIGELFKSRSTTKTKSRFFVFLRCNVLRSQTFEDLKYLSREPLMAAGIDDGFPRLKPRVIR